MRNTENSFINAICSGISILIALPFLVWLFVISWRIGLCFFILMWMNNLQRDSIGKED